MRYFVYCSAILLMLSCSERMEYPLEYYQEKLVVNALLEDGKPIHINVSKSYWGDSSSIYAHKAKVFMWSGNVVDTLDYVGQGNYISTFTAVANLEYIFKIVSKGFETEIVGTTVPLKPFIDTVKMLYDSDYRGRAKFEVTMKDDSRVSNYYMMRFWLVSDTADTLQVTEFRTDKGNMDYYIDFLDHVKANDLSSEIDDLFSPSTNKNVDANAIIFSDEGFVNGMNSIILEPYFPDGEGQGVVALYNLNYDLYLYYQSMASYEASEANLFSSPSSLYSNISDGLGIVASRSVSYDTVSFEYDL